MKRLHVHMHVDDLAKNIAGETTCCYARSDKYWVTDPQGVAWEQFQTLDTIPVFSRKAAVPEGAACCAPKGRSVGIAVKAAGGCC